MNDRLENNPFAKVSDRIFLPLTGKSARQNWSIIQSIFDDFYSGDFVRADPGVPKSDVIESIERSIRDMPDYELTEEDGTPVESRALSGRIYRYLLDTGWLSVERENYVDMVYMEPSVSQLVGALADLANARPSHFGGKVLAIYNTVKSAHADPGEQAPALHQVCHDDARKFSRSLNSIVVRIRDINKRVRGVAKPGEILRTFFDDFVSGIMVADYKKLKTENHPFRFRHDILRLADQMQRDPEKREMFILGYAVSMSLEQEEAEQMFDEDMNALTTVFSNVDTQLDRIDDIKYKLENRVNNLIRYMGKSSDSTAMDIESLIKSLGHIPDDGSVLMPVVAGEPASNARLTKPRGRVDRTPSRPLRNKEPDPRMAKAIKLARAARERRHITPEKLSAYIDRHMLDQSQITSDAMTISSIEDYCALTMLSHLSVNPPAGLGKWGAFGRKYKLDRTLGEITSNDYIEMTTVRVVRVAAIKEIDHVA